MVFNSLVFLLFLAVVLALYYRLPMRGQNVLLVVASYFFYGWWDWRFLGLLLFSTFFDYASALYIEGASTKRRRKWFLAGSMAVNMGILGFFKYFNFFADSLHRVLSLLGFSADLPTLNVILPVGISFYTFLSMSYTIDVYRRELPATRDPLEFMLYVSFFPHLVAGPIVRASYLLPQCQRPRVICREEVLNGIWLCLLGFVKKIVIADHLGKITHWGFDAATPGFSDANVWLVIYAFAFQVYGDFSGYSDIARGLSKLMGFELVVNFRAPYLVTNPASFWRHWHISLSQWLRDYLYVPLGGNRSGGARTYRNLMITMLLGGLWHGAGLAYLAWGLYHGLLLVLHRLWVGASARTERPSTSSPWWRRALLAFGFFQLTSIGWLLFRAGALPASVSQLEMLQQFLVAMVQPLQNGFSALWRPVLLLGGAALWFQWKHELMDRFCLWRESRQALAVGAALASIAAFGEFAGSSFIYFKF